MRNVHTFALLAIAVLIAGLAYAEELTITTYYPSPYGVYNQMQAKRMAVGDTDESGGLDEADLPGADGQLYTARSVIFKPQSGLPASANKEGELVYNGADDSLYLYNGTSWKKSLVSGYCYTYYSTSMASCVCPAGEINRKNLGSWGYFGYQEDPWKPFYSASFRPPGLSCTVIGDPTPVLMWG